MRRQKLQRGEIIAGQEKRSFSSTFLYPTQFADFIVLNPL
jgi:hypothetical protein